MTTAPPSLDVPLVSSAAISNPVPPADTDRAPAVVAVAPVPLPAASPVAAPIGSTVSPPPIASTVSPPPIASTVPPPPIASTVPPPRAVVVPDDDALVKQTLQRYRTAYERLDAGSARAVWPGVNEAALSRAFDGLASQTLVFNGCTVTLHGEAAAAVCRGSTRYVPKIGSREPRTELRTWNFTLRKAESGWMIESAKAER